MAVQLLILGLRRSGTTIFWRAFRQDRRLRCYDEPFNPLIGRLPAPRTLKHPEEFLELLRRDPRRMWEAFASIHFSEELRERLSDAQGEWLSFLGDTGERVALDTTRCQFKVEALHRLVPGAVLVHLHRSPESQVSSHLVPSDRRTGGKLRTLLDRRDFWSRTDRYNGWSFQSIIGDSPQSPFGLRLGEIGLDAQEVYAMPAVGRLLAYWRLNFERVERDGPRLYGERFVSQSFEAFCRDPRAAVERVYERLGLAPPELDLHGVHPPHGPYQPDSPSWESYRQRLGLPRPAAAASP